MKYPTILFVATLLAITATECTTSKKVEYHIPDNYEGKTRENLIRMLDEGQVLYKIHCSKCHGIFTKGKDNIPNFTKTQIENYRASVILEDSLNHAVAQRIRPEDLDRILQFLSFRKKSATASTP